MQIKSEPTWSNTANVEPTVFSVSELNQQVKNLLERRYAAVTVQGEIANFKVSGGHWYFSLRDRRAQLSAVMFKREAARSKIAIKNGDEVTVRGRLTVYPPYGRYQMVVDEIVPTGLGALQAQFEALKNKLSEEGLFAAERKRPLQLVPGRIAVITSATGAVLRDILNVSQRRFPSRHLILIPARVQGVHCATSIVQAFEKIDMLIAKHAVTAVIVARGGGSLEDLAGFNQEPVARAISRCAVPVVSAVGHETDFTICDFVADVRAPTPSAAAELVFPQHTHLVAQIEGAQHRIEQRLRHTLTVQRQLLDAAVARLGSGLGSIPSRRNRVVAMRQRIEQAQRRKLTSRRLEHERRVTRIERFHPRHTLSRERQGLRSGTVACQNAMSAILKARRNRFERALERVRTLSPTATLARGYGIVLGAAGHALSTIHDTEAGDSIRVLLSDGTVRADVVSTEPTQGIEEGTT